MKPLEVMSRVVHGVADYLAEVGTIPDALAAPLGERAVAAALETEPEHKKLTWEQIREPVEFMINQAARLERMDGPAREFAARLRSKEEFRDEDLWAKAYDAQTAVAAKFGLDKENLNLIVSADEQGKQQLVLLHTGQESLPGGALTLADTLKSTNWARDNFAVLLDGEMVDTRLGMTWRVYKDFLKAEKQLGTIPLPDSGMRPTVLTGEDSINGSLLVARPPVRKSTPMREYGWRYSQREIGFRPAIVVGEISQPAC